MKSRKLSPRAQWKASGIRVGDLIQYSEWTGGPGGKYERIQARVEDFGIKHGEALVDMDNGEWRYLSEVRKV